ncbi:CRISPR-associated endonuclease Cas2 [Anaerovorax odorimutans]|uniref:CRISPR-associated endoribonuclease Cas2 n=1 Tax=Anaerovorax odorimutans TaxID=109327 RepID=A0ABT1RLN8_9FIRM|nr:CRISPR-associated endonuclease Cas2 [Anaerovorax odorimutans]MCQ4636087.1 CRISPR-associated endonuclease Cas2 [Anaerovorax odorimutans]
MYVILVYDIVVDDEGKKILPKVFKSCKKYLSHIQNSVFEGDMTKSQMMALKLELQKSLRKDKDSLIVFSSRDQKWLSKEFWGKEDDKTSKFL